MSSVPALPPPQSADSLSPPTEPGILDHDFAQSLFDQIGLEQLGLLSAGPEHVGPYGSVAPMAYDSIHTSAGYDSNSTFDFWNGGNTGFGPGSTGSGFGGGSAHGGSSTPGGGVSGGGGPFGPSTPSTSFAPSGGSRGMNDELLLPWGHMIEAIAQTGPTSQPTQSDGKN